MTGLTSYVASGFLSKLMWAGVEMDFMMSGLCLADLNRAGNAWEFFP